MTLTYDWGDARTYTTLVTALAAASLTVTDDYDFPGYLNTSSSLIYAHTADVLIPNFVNASGYRIDIRGTEGSINDLTSMIALRFATPSDNGLYSQITAGVNGHGLNISNLEIANSKTSGSYALRLFATPSPRVKGCYVRGTGSTFFYAISSRDVPHITDCVVVSERAALNLAAGDGCMAVNSIFYAKLYDAINSVRANCSFDNCTIYGARYGIASMNALGWRLRNTIVSGATHAVGTTAQTIANRQSTYLDKCLFWSIANPTEVQTGKTLAQMFPNDARMITLGDPEYTATGDEKNYFIPTGSSIAIPSNQSTTPNGIYTGNNLTPSEIGAYADASPATTTPGTPTVDLLTPAANQVTVAVTADDPADVVQVFYRVSTSTGAWTENESFKRTGSGDVVVTGLTDLVEYAFQAQAQNVGDSNSLPSNERVATSGTGSGDATPSAATVRDEVYLVVNRTINGGTKRYIEVMSPRFLENPPTSEQAFFVDSGLTYDSTAATVISGLGHLEAEEVAVLADGFVVEDLTVSSGAITLPNAASVVHVGLPITAQLETLDFYIPQPDGTNRKDQREVVSTVFEVEDTREVWIGPSSDRLTEVKFRSDTDNYDTAIAPFTGDKELAVDPGDQRSASVFIEVRNPVPCTILSVIPSIDNGDF